MCTKHASLTAKLKNEEKKIIGLEKMVTKTILQNSQIWEMAYIKWHYWII